MTDLFRSVSFNDDVTPVFDALSEWCKLHKISPDSLAGSTAASLLFDLFQKGLDTKDAMLEAMQQQSLVKH